VSSLEQRYAPHHVGADGPGLGGIFRLDRATARAGFRLSVPSDCTPAALWIFAATRGSPGTLRVRFGLGDPVNPRQPDPGLASFSWSAPADAPAQWMRIALGPGFQGRLLAGAPLHAVFEPESGAFDAGNLVELISVRSRFPLQFTQRVQADGARLQDDLNAFLYSPDLSHPASPYCAQKNGNASFHPIAVVECSRGEHFGNPFDRHTEHLIYGAERFAMVVRPPLDLAACFVAMFLRGAGIAGAGGTPGLPADACYLSVFARPVGAQQGTLLHGPVPIVRQGDRLFRSRSHWFGLWADPPFKLPAGDAQEYVFELSSPGCALANPNDAYVFSADSSTLEGLDVRYVFGQAQSSAGALSPTAISGLIVRDDPPGNTSLALVDEIVGSISAPPGHVTAAFPLTAKSGDTLDFGVMVRNVADVPTAQGGELWSEVLDADDAAVLSPAQLHAQVSGHNESLLLHRVPMPKHDLHLLVRCGHVFPAGAGLGGARIVDDQVPLEVRRV